MAVMYGLVEITPADSRPVSTTLLQQHLRIGDADTDLDYLDRLIRTATEWIETETMETLVPTQYKLILDQFPFYVANRVVPYDYKRGAIMAVRNPLISVDQFTYVDNDGVTQTMTEGTGVGQYQVAKLQMPGRVMPARGTVFPFADYYGVDSVQLTFTAGYAAGKIPYLPRHAILLLAAHLHENREATTDDALTEIPLGVRTIINKRKYMGFC